MRAVSALRETLGLYLYTMSGIGLRWTACWVTIFQDGPCNAPIMVNRFTKTVVIRRPPPKINYF